MDVGVTAVNTITINYVLYNMPVEFEEYDPGKKGDLQFTEDSNAYKILKFLFDNPNQGFTPKEISERTDVPRGSVGTTLSRLEDYELVRHKKPYWAIGKDDRLGAYASMLHGLEAAQDRFGDEDWGEWKSTAKDPRNIETDNAGE